MRVCVASTAPVVEERLSSSRKMITNRQVDLYNQAATDVFSVARKRRGSGSSSSSGVRLLNSPRLAATKPMMGSQDGLHLPDSANKVVGGTCLEFGDILHNCLSIFLMSVAVSTTNTTARPVAIIDNSIQSFVK